LPDTVSIIELLLWYNEQKICAPNKKPTEALGVPEIVSFLGGEGLAASHIHLAGWGMMIKISPFGQLRLWTLSSFRF
jgi:hypothetical protein